MQRDAGCIFQHRKQALTDFMQLNHLPQRFDAIMRGIEIHKGRVTTIADMDITDWRGDCRQGRPDPHPR
ncbi:hypothetical protein SRABI106_02655 [Rahnella aquatilis]|nr:hypothetical protein SRABI106_02655 [Rahnella aquatilis]